MKWVHLLICLSATLPACQSEPGYAITGPEADRRTLRSYATLNRLTFAKDRTIENCRDEYVVIRLADACGLRPGDPPSTCETETSMITTTAMIGGDAWAATEGKEVLFLSADISEVVNPGPCAGTLHILGNLLDLDNIQFLERDEALQVLSETPYDTSIPLGTIN